MLPKHLRARHGMGAPRLPASVALVLVILGGCGGAPSGPPSTPTPDIEATLTASPTPTATDVAPPTPSDNGSGVVFRDRFESLAAWDVSSYTYSGWSLDPSAGADSAPSAALGPYVNDQEAKMGHVVQLPATGPIALRYSAWYEAEAGFDELIVWVHSPGRDDWESLASHSGSSGGDFRDFAVDLSPYAGKDLEIVFGFRSDGRDAIPGGGARVDDVAVIVGGSAVSAPPATQRPGGQDVVSLAQCQAVALGMSPAEVAAIVGSAGQLTNSLGLGQDRIDYYQWVNADGSSMQLGYRGGVVATMECSAGLQ